MNKQLISYSLVFLALQPALCMAYTGQGDDQSVPVQHTAAQPPSPETLLNLAIGCFQAGQNLPQTRTLFEQIASNPNAAESTKAHAQFYLAQMHRDGRGGERNPAQARILYARVIANPHTEANVRDNARFHLTIMDVTDQGGGNFSLFDQLLPTLNRNAGVTARTIAQALRRAANALDSHEPATKRRR